MKRKQVVISIEGQAWRLSPRFDSLFPVRANYGEGKTLLDPKASHMLAMDNDGNVDVEPGEDYQLRPVPGFSHWSAPSAEAVPTTSAPSAPSAPSADSSAAKKRRRILPPQPDTALGSAAAEADAKPKAKKAPAPKAASKEAGGPKRPMTPFFRFSGEKRDEVRRENPGKPVTEQTKILAAMWKEASPQEKQRYEKAYEAELEQFHQVSGKVPKVKKQPQEKKPGEGASAEQPAASQPPSPKRAPAKPKARATPAKSTEATAAATTAPTASQPSAARSLAPALSPSKPKPNAAPKPKARPATAPIIPGPSMKLPAPVVQQPASHWAEDD